jgi:hypothetical protein
MHCSKVLMESAMRQHGGREENSASNRAYVGAKLLT